MKPPDHVIPFEVTDELRPRVLPLEPIAVSAIDFALELTPDPEVAVGLPSAAEPEAPPEAPRPRPQPDPSAIRVTGRHSTVKDTGPRPLGRILVFGTVATLGLALYDVYAAKREATAFEAAASRTLMGTWDSLSDEAVTGRVQALCRERGATCRGLRVWVKRLDSQTLLREQPGLKARTDLYISALGIPVFFECGFEVSVRATGPLVASTSMTVTRTELVSLPPEHATEGESTRD